MKKEIPNCTCLVYPHAEAHYLEIGSVGATRQIWDLQGNLIGVDTIRLYQCENCKKVLQNIYFNS